MKIATIVGARPQFIKSAVVSRAFKQNKKITEIIIHTGQHYDRNMSEIFFKELGIPKPAYNLGVGSGLHGRQTAKMLEGIEQTLIKEKPDWVLVYGDTNSTIAGALASAKLHIKLAHVEAGLRSYNRTMPEEINRIATDHISDICFAPTQNALSILGKEGLSERSVFSGDVMFDSILYNRSIAFDKYPLDSIIDFQPGSYLLATVHRQENTDNIDNLYSIFSALSEAGMPVVIPLHPRTKKMLKEIRLSSNLKIIDPVGYLQMITLLNNCHKVLTDSGGVQKEAFFLKKQCITLREETEWTETLDDNWNIIAGTNKVKIFESLTIKPTGEQKNFFGDGKSAEKIVEYLLSY